MKSDAEARALALVADRDEQRPWWKPTLLMAAMLCLTIGFVVETIFLQLAIQENHRTARHNCEVIAGFVTWARELGPLEKTVRGDSAYHDKRLRAFERLQKTLEREDGIPCP